MSLTFRNGGPEDVPAVARVAWHSFPGTFASPSELEAHYLHSPLGGIETLWVGEEGGRIVASCRLLRFRQWVSGSAIPIMGLGAVAIAPTARRRGLAASMLTAAFAHCRERGDVATALYPFRTSFYGKLGYGMAGEALQYDIPPAALPDHPARSRVALVENDSDRAEVRALYARWAPGQTGQFVREDRIWERVWEKGTRSGVVYRSERGEAEGYAVFRYHSGPARAERFVEVEEIVWLTQAARRGLYAWLSSLSDQWERLVYRAHPDEAFAEYLSELRRPTEGLPRWHFWFDAATTLMGPMFRLLDVPGAWALRAVEEGPPLAVALEVHDAAVAENVGPWRLRFEGGRTSVEAGAGPADLTLRLGIGALSRIFIGALTVGAALRGDVVEADRPERAADLDRLLVLPKPWTFDRF